MLQARPTSASAMIPVQARTGHQYSHGLPHQRGNFHHIPSAVGGSGAYRGASGPYQHYASTSSSGLIPGAQWQQLPRTSRTTSSPAVPTMPNFPNFAFHYAVPAYRYPASVSMTSLPSTVTMNHQSVPGDDSSVSASAGRRVVSMPRPQSSPFTPANLVQLHPSQSTPARPSPERYRRPAQRLVDLSGPVGPAPGPSRSPVEQKVDAPRPPIPQAGRPNASSGPMPGVAQDDIQLHRGNADEQQKRFRRRSMPALDAMDVGKLLRPLSLGSLGDGHGAGANQRRREHRLSRVSSMGDLSKAVHNHSNHHNSERIGLDDHETHKRTDSTDSRSSGRSAGSGSQASSVSLPLVTCHDGC